MSLEQEDLTHLIASDLDLRNRNWTKIEQRLNEIEEKTETQSGSNSNGSWVKYPDGTMFCWAIIEVTEPADVPSGDIYRSETMSWTFPQEFTGDGGFAWFDSTSLNRWVQKTTGPDPISAEFRIFRSASSSVLGTISGFAIGRWK